MAIRSCVALLTVIAGFACGGEGERASRDSIDSLEAARGARRITLTAVQLGSFADSGNAVTLRDSLARAGWIAYVSPAVIGGEPRWRTLVQPNASAELPRLIQHTLSAQGRTAVVVRDSAALGGSASIELFAVNRGARGMLRRLRWALSPDRRSLLALEDPAGVENEPVPDGFVFVSERGPFLTQVDSVWDVSPSPSWERLAYGRAYVLLALGGPDGTPAQWEQLAERMRLTVDSVRRASFASSAMNYAYAAAQPVLLDVSDGALTTSASSAAAERRLAMAGGWAIAWTEDGSMLAVGGAPVLIADDAEPMQWIGVDTTTWSPIGPLDPRQHRWSVVWEEGPLIDVSVAFDMRGARSIAIDGGRVTSREGWIRIARDEQDDVPGGTIIGPGAALAATRTGRFVAALVPRPDAEEHEVPLRFVVYQVIE